MADETGETRIAGRVRWRMRLGKGVLQDEERWEMILCISSTIIRCGNRYLPSPGVVRCDYRPGPSSFPTFPGKTAMGGKFHRYVNVARRGGPRHSPARVITRMFTTPFPAHSLQTFAPFSFSSFSQLTTSEHYGG